MSDPTEDDGQLHAEPRQDYVAEEREEPRRRKPWIKGVITAVVLVGFGVGTWYAYSIGIRAGSEGAAPLIRADQRPTKVKPDDPGGMTVPHQDKTIFDRVKSGDEGKKVEQLLPPPEEPVARPKKAPPQQQAAAPEPAPAPPPSAAPAPAPVPAPSTLPAAAPPPAPEAKAPATETKPAETRTANPPSAAPQTHAAAQAPTAAQLAAPPPIAKTQPTPAPAAATPAVAPAKGGAYKVQIASVPSQEQAEKEWTKAKSANSDLLGALSPSIQRADLGAKGIYYRVQAGPLADDAAAKSLCSSLQARKIGCLVVRP